jgi:hypothetical protein
MLRDLNLQVLVLVLVLVQLLLQEELVIKPYQYQMVVQLEQQLLQQVLLHLYLDPLILEVVEVGL